jgi:hypothetical protein
MNAISDDALEFVPEGKAKIVLILRTMIFLRLAQFDLKEMMDRVDFFV